MIINRQSLADLQTGFRTSFQAGFAGVASTYSRVATVVPSTTSSNKYPWLGQIPGMREWLGPRVVHNLETHGYEIVNKDWEQTVAVKRTHIEDDQIGIYAPMMTEMGRAAAEHPDQLVWSHLAAGFATACFDGQSFFDTDHPVRDPVTGAETSVSNMQAGAGAPWFLLDTSRALKPIIFQERKKTEFTAKDGQDDERVFDRNEYVYGAYGRWNVGYGFWQMAFGSKATLSAENLRAAYTAMTSLKGDTGEPLGIVPNLLVVGNSNHFAARDILMAETIGGSTNTNRNLVEILHVARLA